MSYSDILKNRTAFVGVDQSTKDAIDEYRDELQKALPDILELFYKHVVTWPNLAAMFKDQSRMDYARKAQQDHWMRLFNAKFDEEYAQSVRRIGLIHSRIGLEPTWYIGAYAFTLNHLYAHAAHQYKSRFSPEVAQDKTAKLLRALNQCVMIDMDMAISIYLEENKRSYDEKLGILATNFENTIGAIVEGVSAAATQLEASAASLSSMAIQTAEGANTVSEASEEASQNVTTVSSATEEMTASIAEVASMAGKSSQSSQQAATDADHSVGIMLELKSAIDKVKTVTDLITGISEQTNLLALNATIEAARAGEAGKGFAVVASEVKALANETGQATEEIMTQVNEILARSDAAVRSIEKVKEVIGLVREVSGNTAEAAEQQKEAILEIASNVSKASLGTHQISQNITSISEAAEETGYSAQQVLGAVKELARQGSDLRNAVNKFLSDIRE
ncbi:MAG: globin-coupled sensor protein [Pseudobdellovibrionaceae bacterium]